MSIKKCTLYQVKVYTQLYSLCIYGFNSMVNILIEFWKFLNLTFKYSTPFFFLLKIDNSK